MNSQLTYEGQLSRLYGIWIKNTILTWLTLFLYRSWAKTRMRRYVYRSFILFGDRLEYHGTGKELFWGFCKATIVLAFTITIGKVIYVFATTSTLNTVVHSIAEPINGLIVPLAVMCLLYYGRFSAINYRLTRTSWRGIRGRLTGKSHSYMLFRLKRLLINICTLGLAIGRSDLRAHQYLISRMYLGNQPCTFEGNINALDKINLVTALLFVPTLGASRAWYNAAMRSACWNGTRAGNIYFQGHYTGMGVSMFYLINTLLIFATLGLGTPIVIHRINKFFAENVELLGSVDGTKILQLSGNANATGEGILNAVDDIGMEVDFGLL